MTAEGKHGVPGKKEQEIVDRDEQVKQAAMIWAGAAIFAEQEGKTFEQKLREPGVLTKDGEPQVVGEDRAATSEGEARTFEEALRGYDVTEEEIHAFLKELDESDPADEPWNKEDTWALLDLLGDFTGVLLGLFWILVVIVLIFLVSAT